MSEIGVVGSSVFSNGCAELVTGSGWIRSDRRDSAAVRYASAPAIFPAGAANSHFTLMISGRFRQDGPHVRSSVAARSRTVQDNRIKEALQWMGC